MMYFVDNFKLQDYEGERQLLLVYHHDDTDAAELVKQYANGVTIKGVAARSGSAQEFPNSQALRYGAWSADADVIARWEFEEWHDPSRLSMQVRALAATARPGCILGRKPEQSTIGNTAEPTNGATAEKSVVADTSLAGSRSWMKVYWKPHLLESSVDESWVPPPEAHIVQLNMFNVRLASDASPLQPVHAQEVKDVEPKHAVEEVPTKVHEWSLQECLELDNSPAVPPLAAETEAALDKNNGQGMSKMFHKLMTRRHDISQKLQLLCMETNMESDLKEHTFKRQHVEQMVSIRGHLDKHIASVVDSFPDLKQLAAEETKSAVGNSESGSFPEEELGV